VILIIIGSIIGICLVPAIIVVPLLLTQSHTPTFSKQI
jgi:hypothetical protein